MTPIYLLLGWYITRGFSKLIYSMKGHKSVLPQAWFSCPLPTMPSLSEASPLHWDMGLDWKTTPDSSFLSLPHASSVIFLLPSPTPTSLLKNLLSSISLFLAPWTAGCLCLAENLLYPAINNRPRASCQTLVTLTKSSWSFRRRKRGEPGLH